MTNEEIIRELKNVEKEYENKPTPTFSINISSMARSCRQHIEQLAEENKKLEAKNKVLKQIIQDLLAHADGCECCTAKGQHAPACECMHDAECVEHMIKLYTEVK